MLIIFTTGAIGSNVALLPFMPLRRPGRLFLFLQLTRVAILYVIWLAPTLKLFYAALLVWGINQGMTATLPRAMVQELAPSGEGARILSVLILSFMVSAPVSAILLGVLVERFDPMAGLVPGMAISLVIFGIGVMRSGLWSYQSTANVPRNDSG
ncbi:MAG: MFS transporter [Gammaproteobacteria bacterium]|nr:MFS transporter [Gammaproteobacteria bacterium]